MVTLASLRAKLYQAVDSQFTTTITITPYKPAAYLTAPIPDTSRQVVETTGVVISHSFAIANALRAAGSLAFLSRRAEADTLLKVSADRLANIRSGDRIYVTELGQTFEISYMEEPAYGRQIIHLTRVPT